jgi:enoyl-CoA hydratase/carnithine racemase
MRAAMHLSLTQAIAYEAQLQTGCLESADAKEGIAAFLARRKPEFRGN